MQSWLAELDRLEALNAETIIPGHILPGLPFNKSTFDYTREYIRLFDQLVNAGMTADEIVASINARYPDADPESEFLLRMSANVHIGD